MRAMRIVQPGPGGLILSEVPAPTPGPGEVRVAVHASAANRADLLQTLGLYPAPPDVPADIPGLEYAGVVDEVGERCSRLRPGDRVLGLVAGGAFAEKLVAHEREVMRVPEGLSLRDAAAIPEAFVTAWDALVLQGGLVAGSTALIHAVGSGVGTAAVQLARAAHARAIGTARSPDKLARCKALGLAEGILCDTDPPAFAEKVKALTDGRGADVVLDLAGGSYFPETLEATAHRGTIVLVGVLAGLVAEANLRTVLFRRLTLRGTTLRSRPLEEKIAVALEFERQVLPLFARGALAPVVDAVLPMQQAGEALSRLQHNRTFGKLVLEWQP